MLDTAQTIPSMPHDRAAFDRTAPLRAALDLGQAPPYTLDAMYAAAQALGIARRLEAHRAALAALSGFDIGHLDHLADQAKALQFVQWTLIARAERVRGLPALAEEGYQLRTLLLAYADVLVLKGEVAPDVVKRLRDGSGYRDLMEDLGALVKLLTTCGDATLVNPADLDRAAHLADAMTEAVGSVQDPDLGHDTLITERRKLGVLLLRSVAQLRRAMTYLRFEHGDAADLVPSLYVPGRPNGGAPATPEAAPLESVPVANAPAFGPSAPSDSPFET